MIRDKSDFLSSDVGGDGFGGVACCFSIDIDPSVTVVGEFWAELANESNAGPSSRERDIFSKSDISAATSIPTMRIQRKDRKTLESTSQDR